MTDPVATVVLNAALESMSESDKDKAPIEKQDKGQRGQSSTVQVSSASDGSVYVYLQPFPFYLAIIYFKC